MEPETTRQFATERPTLTNETAERYLPRIRRHAARIARRLPRHVQVGDLVSAGFVGLVDAFMKFDVSRMESFDAYVDHRIRGAILDELRAHDPLTRDQRIFARRLATARQTAANETGGSPDEVEVARALGINVVQYRAQVERMAATAARSEAAPYDEESVEASEPTHDRPDELAEQHEQRSRIAAAMDRLPPPQARGAAHALRRGAHPARDRRAPRRDRVAGVADPLRGRAAPPHPALQRLITRRACAAVHGG
jgi:RNA polymerase sigma factor for flagellar operon FliA